MVRGKPFFELGKLLQDSVPTYCNVLLGGSQVYSEGFGVEPEDVDFVVQLNNQWGRTGVVAGVKRALDKHLYKLSDEDSDDPIYVKELGKGDDTEYESQEWKVVLECVGMYDTKINVIFTVKYKNEPKVQMYPLYTDWDYTDQFAVCYDFKDDQVLATQQYLNLHLNKSMLPFPVADDENNKHYKRLLKKSKDTPGFVGDLMKVNCVWYEKTPLPVHKELNMQELINELMAAQVAQRSNIGFGLAPIRAEGNPIRELDLF